LDIDGFSHGIASINHSHSSHGTDILMCCTIEHIQQKLETSFEQRFCLIALQQDELLAWIDSPYSVTIM